MSAGGPLARGWTVLTALLLAGCSTAPRPYLGSPERGQMRAHFDLADDLRELAVHGDLPRFRATAQDLADLDPVPDLAPGIIVQLGPMRREAQGAAGARTPAAAARGSAEVARACGECHRANGVTLGESFVFTAPSAQGGAGGHMAGLAWVTRLLWEGLVGPSDAAWAVGSEALSESGALPDDLLERLPASDVQLASTRLRTLGREASGAVGPDDRARTLGEIWATCAGCHTDARTR